MSRARGLIAISIVAVSMGTAMACSTFGSADDATPRDASAVDGPATAEGGADSSDAASDACTPLFVVNETFEDPGFPPQGFEANVSDPDAGKGTGTVMRAPDIGVGGGAAFSSTVSLPDAGGEGPRARIDRTFEVVPSDIVMELDLRSPSAPGLFSQVGCALFLYGSSARNNDPVRTEVTLVSNDAKSLKLAATVQPGNQTLDEKAAGPKPSSEYLHTKVHLTFAPNNMVHAELDVQGGTSSFDFALAIAAKSITLACGVIYADSTTGQFVADVDNLSVKICGRAP